MTKFVFLFLSLYSWAMASESQECRDLGRDLLSIQNQIFTNQVGGNQLINLQNEYNQKLAELSILENIFVLQHNFENGFRGLGRMQEVNREVARERLARFNEHAQNAIFVQEVIGNEEHLRTLLNRSLESRIMSRGFRNSICGESSPPLFCAEFAALSPERQNEIGDLLTNIVVSIRTRLQSNSRNRDEIIRTEVERFFSSFNYGDQSVRQVSQTVNSTQLENISSITLGAPGGNYFRSSELQREFGQLQTLAASFSDGQADTDKIAKIRASLMQAQRNIREGSRGRASPLITSALACLNGEISQVKDCLKRTLNTSEEISAQALREKKAELDARSARIDQHMANPDMQVLEQLKNYGVLRYRSHCQESGPRDRSEVVSYCDGRNMAQGSYFSKVLNLSDSTQQILLHASQSSVELNQTHLNFLRAKCARRNAVFGDYMCRGLRTPDLSLEMVTDVSVQSDAVNGDSDGQIAATSEVTRATTSTTRAAGSAVVNNNDDEDNDDDEEDDDDREYRRRRSRNDYYDDGSAGWQALAQTMQLGGSALQLGLARNQSPYSQYTPQMFPQGTPSYYNPMWNYNANMYLSLAQRPAYYDFRLYGMSTGNIAAPYDRNQLAPMAPINFTY